MDVCIYICKYVYRYTDTDIDIDIEIYTVSRLSRIYGGLNLLVCEALIY
jgi:hypothetical protein